MKFNFSKIATDPMWNFDYDKDYVSSLESLILTP